MIFLNFYKKSFCVDVVVRSNEEVFLVFFFLLLICVIFFIVEFGIVFCNILVKGILDCLFEVLWFFFFEFNGMIYGYCLFYIIDLIRDFSLWRYKLLVYNEIKVEGL